jgi:hypothetical protein
MVTKTKKQGGVKGKKGKIKVLNLNKETIKDLTDDETKGVKGGDSYTYPVVVQSFVAQSVLSSGSLRSGGRLSGSYPISG